MALTPTLADDGGTSTDPLPGAVAGTHVDAPDLQLFVFALFFIFGGITSLNDILIPKLKELFTLSNFQAMLIQSAFFGAYLIVSLPGAALVKRVGYMRGATIGLLTMMVGCLLFIPASSTATFTVFLLALFVLASGVVIVQVVANPLISLLGPAASTHSRLTFAQAFNSLGTTVFPYFGAALILGSLATLKAEGLSGAALDAYRADESRAIVSGYIGIAAALAVVALVVWLRRDRIPVERHAPSSLLAGFDLLRHRRFRFGAASIFLYVGAEVAIGSVIVNYLEQATVLNLGSEAAGKLVPLYWGGALVGRFIGSAVLRFVSPGKLLAAAATGSIALILLSANSTGALSGYSLLAIGLMNAIMFPTIFSLACEGLDERAADGSGIICVAIVGGAVIPPLTGLIADATGSLAFSLALPAVCYALIAGFGLFARRPAVA